jgi:hypothetical protein
MSALSPEERRASQELTAEAQQDADNVQCWALPTATSTQQFALPMAGQTDHVHTAEADERPAPAAAKPPNQTLVLDAVASPQDVDAAKAIQDSRGTSGPEPSGDAPAAEHQ